MGRLIARGTIKRELLGDCRSNYARIIFRDRFPSLPELKRIVTTNYGITKRSNLKYKKFINFKID